MLGAVWDATTQPPDSFVFSLSEDPDSLPQWQAYGEYALGFPGGHLRRAGDAHGFVLGKCIYARAEQNRLGNELIDYYVALAQGGTRPEDAAKEFMESLWAYAPLLKDPSFVTEAEWRLFSPPKD